jgi:glycerophosphoryl diester phosphodiesterase
VLKYPAIEIDLKQTKDGIFVLSHDPKWGDAVLEQTNFNDLKDVEYTVVKTGGLVGGHLTDEERTYTAKICTFERYLEICKQYGIIAIIELKTSAGISNWTEANSPKSSRMPKIMELIKKFNTREEYEAYKFSGEYKVPNVCIIDDTDVEYNSNDPFWIEPLEDVTITMENNNHVKSYYSFDKIH